MSTSPRSPSKGIPMASSVTPLSLIWQEEAGNDLNSADAFWQKICERYGALVHQALATSLVFTDKNVYIDGICIEQQDSKVTELLEQGPSIAKPILFTAKPPQTKLLGARYRKIFRASDNLSGAVIDALDQLKRLQREIRSLLRNGSAYLDAFTPRAVLVIGSSNDELIDEEKRYSLDLYRRRLAHVEVITFDELLENIESLTRKLPSN